MTGTDLLKTMMTSKYDEGKAAIREMIRRNGNEEMLQYASRLINGMASENVDVHLKNALALQGLFGAWLELLNEEAEGMSG